VNSPVAILVLIAVASGLLALVFAGLDRLVSRRRKSKPEPTREVVILCRDDSSFGGVELRRDAAGILLGAPKLLPDDGPPVKLEGDLWVPATNIRAIQIIGPTL